MKSEEIKELFKQFESIVCEYNKVECWSARELYPLLGYSQWRTSCLSYRKQKIHVKMPEKILHTILLTSAKWLY